MSPSRPDTALTLAGGWCWFEELELLRRNKPAERIPWQDAPKAILENLTAKRTNIMGLSMDHPRVMGIVNVTPDSFSDGGAYAEVDGYVKAARDMAAHGADILDIGGESTRPGAQEVAIEEEIIRVQPVIFGTYEVAPISIDTRKSEVAEAALAAGATLINDVSALTFDPKLASVVATAGVPVCLMHAQGAPENMQDNPQYEDVLLDVYDGLENAIQRAQDAGIKKRNIVIDPGIGFGKSLDHNLQLIRRISIFHSLGVPVLLGASRKRFIGTITGESDAKQRLAGSLSVALYGLSQGIQITRVHDSKETAEAFQMAMKLCEQE